MIGVIWNGINRNWTPQNAVSSIDDLEPLLSLRESLVKKPVLMIIICLFYLFSLPLIRRYLPVWSCCLCDTTWSSTGRLQTPLPSLPLLANAACDFYLSLSLSTLEKLNNHKHWRNKPTSKGRKQPSKPKCSTGSYCWENFEIRFKILNALRPSYRRATLADTH